MMRWTLDHGNPLPPGWSYLPRDEEDVAWELFRDRFRSFRPSIYPKDWPAVVDPAPSVTPDFSSGTFGHPWEKTLCVFGSELVQTLGRTLATWLPRKRENGDPLPG